MNKSSPKISIITPAYNAEGTIAEAIESVLQQDWSNWELLVVDDGSQDRTASVVKSYSSDRRVKLFSQKNAGVSAARNKAIESSTGDLICFLDADDVLPNRSLSSRANALILSVAADIADGTVLVKNSDMKDNLREYRPIESNDLKARLLMLSSKHFFGPSYMIRASLVGETRFSSSMSHCEDMAFFLELASKKTCSTAVVSEEIYFYRTGQSSAMSNLEGLSVGYLNFFQRVQLTSLTHSICFVIGKLKAAKILALSWLRRGKYSLGIQWALRLIFCTTKEARRSH